MVKRKRSYSRTRRSNKRRRVSTRRRRMRNVMSPSRTLNRTGLPQTMRMKMVYQDYHDHYSSSSLPFTYVYSSNDIYDPNVTGTGHKPRYYNEIAPLYNRWWVKACKISVELVAHNASLTLGVGSVMSNIGVHSIIEELPRWKVKSTGNVNSKGACKVNVYQKIKDVVGQPGLSMWDDSFYGGTTASPSKKSFFQILVQHYNKSSISSASFTVRLRLTYYVTFTGLKFVYQS